MTEMTEKAGSSTQSPLPRSKQAGGRQYRKLSPLKIQTGDFEAWIAATNLPPSDGGFSACAFEFKGRGSPEVFGPETFRSADKSDEQRGYVWAAVGLAERLPAHSSVILHSRNIYVVDAINFRLDGWRNNGWRKANGEPVEHREIWERFISATEPRDITVRAEHVTADDVASQAIIERLKDVARKRCRNR